MTLSDIAKDFGCNKSTIERCCKELGLKKKRTGPKNGEKHPCWKGGVTMRKGYRYIYMPDHPHCTKAGYVLEHRLVMEDKLGRHLLPTEVCHHRDGDRLNNSASNLEVFQSNGEHLKHELSGRVPNWTDAGKKRIREAIEKAFQLRGIDRQPEFCDHLAPQSSDHHQE
ncbi:MAG: HNH endonuclease [Deltaproteobacteria bacterium]|nr:HNH endonuclease [Deltaproteobacteria bacterium]